LPRLLVQVLRAPADKRLLALFVNCGELRRMIRGNLAAVSITAAHSGRVRYF
jgi:hypothetical protein